MSIELERGKSYLQSSASATPSPLGLLGNNQNKGQRTLYDHLTDLVLLLIKDKPKPEEALVHFERLSVLVKNSHILPENFREIPALPVDPDAKLRWLKSVEQVLAEIKEDQARREELPTDAHNPALLASSAAAAQAASKSPYLLHRDIKQTKIQDLSALYQSLLSQAGVALDEETVFRLSLAMKKVSEQENAKGEKWQLASIRFWGVLHGLQTDYYLLEAKRALTPKPPAKPPTLPAPETPEHVTMKKIKGRAKPIYDQSEYTGYGANEFIYFVATAAPTASAPQLSLTTWEELPAVTPEQIKLSRHLRRYLTGSLDAPVLGFPRFPGQERHYLRALVARISAATLIAPAGFYTTEENEAEGREVVVEDEGYEGASGEELKEAGAWTHYRPHLLKAGRTTQWEEPEEEEEEAADAEEEEEEAETPPNANALVDEKALAEEEEEKEEEPHALFTSVEEDVAPVGAAAAWRFRSNRPTQPAHPHSVTSASSLWWPGATAVVKGRQLVNVYIGAGVKQLGRGIRFTPKPNELLQTEYEPVFNAEEEEKNPLDEQADPLPPADLDDEEKEEGEEEEEEEEEEDAGEDDDE